MSVEPGRYEQMWPCDMCDKQLMDELLRYMGNRSSDAADNYLRIRAIAQEMQERCAKRATG